MKTLKLNFTKDAFLAGLLTLLLVMVSGCGDSSVTNPSSSSSDKSLSVSVKSDNSIDNPADEIVITEAKALITEIEFELEGSGTSQEIKAGPIVVNFNLSGGIQTILSSNIPSGVYNKVKFQIHKPEDTEPIPDPEFREGTSGNQRYSFIVKGSYNGNSFIYKSRKSTNIVINFDKAVNFQATGLNLTVLFNQFSWFKSGSVILDPGNSSHENEIDDNIKSSFKRAFKDDDKNGSPDE
jgi:hypothetical protein